MSDLDQLSKAVDLLIAELAAVRVERDILRAQVAAVERYAQFRAITAAARGGQRDRPWLDLLHIIERAEQDSS